MSSEKYLEQEVLAAPPQKLQLLLIDAAIRHIKLAKQVWADVSPREVSEPEKDEASSAIVRAEKIMVQMLSGIRSDRNLSLVRHTSAIYGFVMGALAKAHLYRDRQSLDDALRVLEIERETWRQVCQHLGNELATIGPGVPHFVQQKNALHDNSSSGFSLDA